MTTLTIMTTLMSLNNHDYTDNLDHSDKPVGRLSPPPTVPKRIWLFILDISASIITNIFLHRQERAHHSAVVIDNILILIGGMNETESL